MKKSTRESIALFALAVIPRIVSYDVVPESLVTDSSYRERGFWSFIQKGERNLEIPSQCDLSGLEFLLLSSDSGPAKVQDFMDHCGEKLRSFEIAAMLTNLAERRLFYNFENNRKVQKLFLHDIEGMKIRAHLLVQPEDKPRPLIIFKCGVLCNVGESSVQKYMALLGDLGTFHVLAVGNISGSDYWKDNNTIAMGGLDEGRQLFGIAQFVRSKEFFLAPKISHVHVYGISLGGHAALFSALYNDAVWKETGVRAIDSVMADSPVVDLGTSIEDFVGPNRSGNLVAHVMWRRLTNLASSVPLLGVLFPEYSEPDIERLPSLMKGHTFDYYKLVSQRPGWWLPPFDQEKVALDTPENFWSLNRFDRHLDGLVSPLWITASENDFVVQRNHNADLITAALKEKPNSPVRVLNLPSGGHCAASQAYGWYAWQTLVRAYFLRHSPGFEFTREVDAPLENILRDESKLPLLQSSGLFQRRKIYWEAVEGSQMARLQSIFSRPGCSSGNANCEQIVTVKIPLSRLAIEPSQIPRSRAEAQGLTRFLNANVGIYDSRGRPVSSTSDVRYFRRARW